MASAAEEEQARGGSPAEPNSRLNVESLSEPGAVRSSGYAAAVVTVCEGDGMGAQDLGIPDPQADSSGEAVEPAGGEQKHKHKQGALLELRRCITYLQGE